MAIKPLNIDATIDVVHYADPAIDVAESNIEAYQKSMLEAKPDLSLLKYKDGQDPTVFVVGVIPSHKMSALMDDMILGQRQIITTQWRAFLCALRDLRNGPTMTETPKSGRPRQIVPKIEVNGIDYVDPEWIGNIFVRNLRQMACDIGLTAIRWNQMDDDTAKN